MAKYIVDEATGERTDLNGNPVNTSSSSRAAPRVNLSPSSPKTFQIANAGIAGAGNAGSGGGSGGGGSYGTSGMGSSATTSGGGMSGGSGQALDWVSAIFNGVMSIWGANETQNNNNRSFGLQEKTQKLAEQAQKWNQSMGMEQLLLNREATRLNQATTQEGLSTSGTNRYQSEVAFAQSQQDRAKQAQFAKAIAAGMARGLAQRSPGMIAPAAPVNYNQRAA